MVLAQHGNDRLVPWRRRLQSVERHVTAVAAGHPPLGSLAGADHLRVFTVAELDPALSQAGRDGESRDWPTAALGGGHPALQHFRRWGYIVMNLAALASASSALSSASSALSSASFTAMMTPLRAKIFVLAMPTVPLTLEYPSRALLARRLHSALRRARSSLPGLHCVRPTRRLPGRARARPAYSRLGKFRARAGVTSNA